MLVPGGRNEHTPLFKQNGAWQLVQGDPPVQAGSAISTHIPRRLHNWYPCLHCVHKLVMGLNAKQFNVLLSLAKHIPEVSFEPYAHEMQMPYSSTFTQQLRQSKHTELIRTNLIAQDVHCCCASNWTQPSLKPALSQLLVRRLRLQPAMQAQQTPLKQQKQLSGQRAQEVCGLVFGLNFNQYPIAHRIQLIPNVCTHAPVLLLGGCTAPWHTPASGGCPLTHMVHPCWQTQFWQFCTAKIQQLLSPLEGSTQFRAHCEHCRALLTVRGEMQLFRVQRELEFVKKVFASHWMQPEQEQAKQDIIDATQHCLVVSRLYPDLQLVHELDAQTKLLQRAATDGLRENWIQHEPELSEGRQYPVEHVVHWVCALLYVLQFVIVGVVPGTHAFTPKTNPAEHFTQTSRSYSTQLVMGVTQVCDEVRMNPFEHVVHDSKLPVVKVAQLGSVQSPLDCNRKGEMHCLQTEPVQTWHRMLLHVLFCSTQRDLHLIQLLLMSYWSQLLMGTTQSWTPDCTILLQPVLHSEQVPESVIALQ